MNSYVHMLESLYSFDKKNHGALLSEHLPFKSVNSNTRVACERCSRLIKKLARRKSIVLAHLLGLNFPTCELYTLFECFYRRFSKSK